MKHIPNNYSDDEDVLARTLRQKKNTHDSDDEYGGLSLGSLSSAQKQMHESESESDEDSGQDEFFDNSQKSTKKLPTNQKKKQKHKHAPSESSSKKPVSKIRNLTEVLNPKYNKLHQDIRFDAAYGKADLRETRQNYAFLDNYRQQEIQDLQKLIRDKKSFDLLLYNEQEETKLRLQSLKSRLDTLKNRDLEYKILDDYKKEQMQNFREGKQSNPYFLKRSEQRKLIQKAKFESMKPKQREKVIERKRKRKLGKEFKQLEFRNNN